MNIQLSSTAVFECRIDRVELGREARKRLRDQLTCPTCNEVHRSELASLLAFVNDEARALRELLNDEMEKHALTKTKLTALQKERTKNGC